jgi:hypothetical protein
MSMTTRPPGMVVTDFCISPDVVSLNLLAGVVLFAEATIHVPHPGASPVRVHPSCRQRIAWVLRCGENRLQVKYAPDQYSVGGLRTRSDWARRPHFTIAQTRWSCIIRPRK